MKPMQVGRFFVIVDRSYKDTIYGAREHDRKRKWVEKRLGKPVVVDPVGWRIDADSRRQRQKKKG